MAKGPSVVDVAGWRVACLLLGFVVVTICFEVFIKAVERALRKRKGLLVAFNALKNELLYLGLISLLLSVTQVLAQLPDPPTVLTSVHVLQH
jgi:hypothetical protein